MLHYDGILIRSPMRLPGCILSLIVGVYLYRKVHKLKYTNYQIYQTVFLSIGCMMTCAAIFDCFVSVLPRQYNIYKWIFGVTDVALTGTIGLGFGLAGLCDAGYLKSGKLVVALYLAIFVTLWILWHNAIENDKAVDAFTTLYLRNVVVGCGLWVIIQFKLMVSKKSTAGLE